MEFLSPQIDINVVNVLTSSFHLQVAETDGYCDQLLQLDGFSKTPESSVISLSMLFLNLKTFLSNSALCV